MKLRDCREERDWRRPWADPPGWRGPGCCCGGNQVSRVVVSHRRNEITSQTLTPTVFNQTAVNGVWANLADVRINDSSFAEDTWPIASGTLGDIADFTDFGFNIPSDATINGITVTIRKNRANNGNAVQDQSVQLIKNGTPQGDDKASGSNWATAASVSNQTYGSNSDLWSLTWTPAEANAIGLRVQPKTTGASGDAIARITQIEITIKWTTSTLGHVTCLDDDLNFVWRYDRGVATDTAEPRYIPSNPIIDDDGNVYVKFESRHTTTGGTSLNRVELVKLDKDGSQLWVWTAPEFIEVVSIDALQANPFVINQISFTQDGNVIVPYRLSETSNYWLSIVDPSGASVIEFSYPGGGLPGGLNFTSMGARAVGYASNGDLIVCCNASSGESQRFLRVDTSGNLVFDPASAMPSAAMVVDPVNDVLYHSSQTGSTTSRTAITKRLLSDFSSVWTKSQITLDSGVTGGQTQITAPQQMAIDAFGNVYGPCEFYATATGGFPRNTHFCLDSSGSILYVEDASTFGFANGVNPRTGNIANDPVTQVTWIACPGAGNDGFVSRVFKCDGSGQALFDGFPLGEVPGTDYQFFGIAAKTFDA